MQEDSSEGEQPKKLQISPPGRKHLVFFTDLSRNLILSSSEEYSELKSVGLPFPVLGK